jgi:hypothetical protein
VVQANEDSLKSAPGVNWITAYLTWGSCLLFQDLNEGIIMKSGGRQFEDTIYAELVADARSTSRHWSLPEVLPLNTDPSTLTVSRFRALQRLHRPKSRPTPVYPTSTTCGASHNWSPHASSSRPCCSRSSRPSSSHARRIHPPAACIHVAAYPDSACRS